MILDSDKTITENVLNLPVSEENLTLIGCEVIKNQEYGRHKIWKVTYKGVTKKFELVERGNFKQGYYLAAKLFNPYHFNVRYARTINELYSELNKIITT